MSSNDHGREFDTVMVAAFRRAGYDVAGAQALPVDPQTSSSRQLPLRTSVFSDRQPSTINLGSGCSPELDLHGCSENQAYEKLEKFMKECAREGYRKVLVITVKGSGKLKRLVPLWLEAGPFKGFVTNACVADPWDGDDGALYVRVRER